MKERTRGCGMLGTVRRRAGWVALLLLFGGSPLWTSCYGKFPLTRTVYRMNGSVTDNKFVHSAVMWVLVWIPVYGVAVLGDAVVCNLYEFWTGKTIEVASARTPDGAEVSIRPAADRPDAVLLTLRRDGQTLSEEKLIRISASELEVSGQDGRATGRLVRDASGRIRLIAADGTVTASGLTLR
jgi:hypothetical protein